ncbi:MAG: hypothetical protein PHH98_01680 [Candidatus Gracilibacteria bacterium]|nr:hypothetical protein [Candidatus Gracilibacteria bacterium]
MNANIEVVNLLPTSNGLKSELDNGSGLMGEIGVNGEGLSDSELTEMISVGNVFEVVHQNDEKNDEIYKKDLSEIFFINDSETDKRKAVEHIVEQVGRLDNIFGKRNLSDDIALILKKIEKKGNLEINDSCYFVPGSLASLKKLIKFGIVNIKDIKIKLGKGVNFQEGIRFIKLGRNGYENAVLIFSSDEIIDNLSLDIGSNSSIAHSVSFYPKRKENGNYEITIQSGSNVFLGINSIIGSGTSIGNNTVIWWNSIVGTDVKIGNDSLIGTSCNIENGSIIPDNCLVPNFSNITNNIENLNLEKYLHCKQIIEESTDIQLIEDSKAYLSKTFIIDYEDYIKNQNFYNYTIVNENKSRKFIVRFKSKQDLNNGLEGINPDYKGMINFNSHHVTPENKIFLAITSLLNYLNKNIDGFEKSKEYNFKSSRSIDEVYKLFGGKISKEILKNELESDCCLTTIPYPKNTQKFLTITFPYILKLLEHGVDNNEIIKILNEELERPKIDEEKISSRFLGKCIITGRCEINGEDTLLYDTLIRSDELNYENQSADINNSVFAKVIIHGPGDKKSNNVVVLNTVFHGESSIINTDINRNIVGDYNHPSTYNNTIIINSVVNTGNITCNNAEIRNSRLGNSISIAGGKDEKIKIIDSEIERKNKIAPGVELYGVDIKITGYYMGKGSILENKIITPNGIFSK